MILRVAISHTILFRRSRGARAFAPLSGVCLPRCVKEVRSSFEKKSLRNCDQNASTDAERMLVARTEFVFVARFEIPADAMLVGMPEHEVENRLSACRIGRRAGFSGVNPFRAGSDHELDFLGESPGLLEEQVGAPLGRAAAEERRDAGFEL